MKKEQIKNLAELESKIHSMRIQNKLTAEAEDLAVAIETLVAELRNAEDEVTKEDLDAIVREKLDGAKEEVLVAVEESIAKHMASVNAPKVEGKAQITNGVKKQIANAMLKSRSRKELEENMQNIMVANAISGLTFNDVIDYAFVEAWDDFNPLFSQLRKTNITKFFYNDDTLATVAILAKQWDKTGETEKEIQELGLTPKTITTQYTYKRQVVAQEDLDEAAKEGNETSLVESINEELGKQVINTDTMAILVGDQINEAGKKITSFESIGSKTVSDAFTTVVTPATPATYTLAELRSMCDKVKNPYGKKKVLVIDGDVFSAVSGFVYAEGGTTYFRSKEEMAGQLGVDEIITFDLHEVNASVHAVCLLPDGYWVNIKKTLELAYAKWERNEMNYQREMNVGGKIHDLFSTAVYRETSSESSASSAS